MKSKARENLKVVKTLYKCAATHELNAFGEKLDRNVEWIEPTVEGLWFSGMHRGAEAVLKEVMEPAEEKVERFHPRMKKFFAVGDNVIAIGSIRGRGTMTQEPLAAETAHVWTLRDGKVIRFEAFHDPAQWQKVVGLAGPEPQAMAA